MMKHRRSLILALLLSLILAATGGCSLGNIAGWGTAGFGGTFFGSFLGTLLGNGGGNSTTTTIERFCYENGVQVDCSTIPVP